MSDIIIVEETEAQEEASAEIEAIEAVEETEAVEVVADASVEIAAIEAERDITIAAIHAEVAHEVNAASIAASEEDVEWRKNFDRLSATTQSLLSKMEQLEGMLSTLQAPPSLPMNPPEGAEDVLPEAVELAEVEAAPEPAPVAKVKKLRWI